MSAKLKFPEISGYVLRERIGGGAFSDVFKAINYQYKAVEACKVLYFKQEPSSAQRKLFDKEIRIHSVLKHANVIALRGNLIIEPNDRSYIPGAYLLMEFAHGGDLFDKIAPDVGVSEDLAHGFFKQLIAGVGYIHSHGVAHRDLKPENILLSKSGNLKIADFGLSKVYRYKGKVRMLSEWCGTRPYVAPEVAGHLPYAGEPVDVWGAGVVLFTLLVGNTPWEEPTTRSAEFSRYQSGRIFEDSPWNRIQGVALDLLCKMLEVDPSARMKLTDIPSHPWYLRQSQLTSDRYTRAQLLTEGLRQAGDMCIANPTFSQSNDTSMDNSMQSQFTQGLQLFSQTQTGKRYIQYLTRFYAKASPEVLMSSVLAALPGMKGQLQVKEGTPIAPAVCALRVIGYGERMDPLKGLIQIEPFHSREHGDLSLCIMQREAGCPLSWKKLWRSLILSSDLNELVLRK